MTQFRSILSRCICLFWQIFLATIFSVLNINLSILVQDCSHLVIVTYLVFDIFLILFLLDMVNFLQNQEVLDGGAFLHPQTFQMLSAYHFVLLFWWFWWRFSVIGFGAHIGIFKCSCGLYTCLGIFSLFCSISLLVLCSICGFSRYAETSPFLVLILSLISNCICFFGIGFFVLGNSSYLVLF